MKNVGISGLLLIFVTLLPGCRGEFETIRPDDQGGSSVFQQKCSRCHDADRNSFLQEDTNALDKTILRMSRKKGAEITGSDREKLIRAHIEEQEATRDIFLKDCTSCHEAGKFLQNVATKGEWQKTVRQMMTRAKKEINNESIDLLVNYHIRSQNMIMEQCSQCHTSKRILALERDEETWRKMVIGMSQKVGSAIDKKEIDIIIGYHLKRQKKAQELLKQNCSNCHKRKDLHSPSEEEKSPKEWRKTIRRMMGKAGKTLGDENIDILMEYHTRAHNEKTLENLRTESKSLAFGYVDLFGEKCSECHSLEKAIDSFRDEGAWQMTIEAMAEKSGGNITDSEISKLVDIHLERQKKERDLFLKDCTRCHGSDVALELGKTHDEWRETASKMMKSDGKKIDEEELDILTHFHTRYEKTIARLSMEKCSQCHDRQRILMKTGTEDSWNKTISAMSTKEGGAISHEDMKRLTNYHMARQKIEQEVFKKDCSECHQSGETLKKKMSREEWREIVRQMMSKTEKMINNEEIDTLIDYHIRKSR